MSKLTSFNTQIPNRISVSFDNRTEKFVIEKKTDGSLKVEHNRRVLKKVSSMQEVLNCIAELLGNKIPEKPDLKRNDEIRVPLDNGFFGGDKWQKIKNITTIIHLAGYNF